MKDGKKAGIATALLLGGAVWALTKVLKPAEVQAAITPAIATGAKFKLSNLIAPREEFIGIPSNIICTVTNIGDGYGGYFVDLKVDGVLAGSQQVDLNPGKSFDVYFKIALPAYLGSYTISVDGLSATVKVVARPTSTKATPEQTAEEIAAAEAELQRIKDEAAKAWGDEIVAQAIVTGKVTRLSTGKLTTATVTVGGYSSKTDGSSSLGSGFYYIGPLPAGTYTVIASAPGYTPQLQTRALGVNENVIDFDLYPSDYNSLVAQFQAAVIKSWGEEFVSSPSGVYDAAKAWKAGNNTWTPRSPYPG